MVARAKSSSAKVRSEKQPLTAWKAHDQKILSCKKCPRLRKYCEKIAREKKREFRDQTYVGLPVPGFGDHKAEVLIVGLAPAAHGANRTGRMFTGDNSGLWLYRALYRAGFSNQEKSVSRDDDLELNRIFIAAVNRCAPPGNKPEPQEILNCRPYLLEEMAMLEPYLKGYLVLGQIALKGLWAILPEDVRPARALPKFAHGAQVKLNDGRFILCSFHPSQQNTFTKKLTEPMFDGIFSTLNSLLKTKG